MVVIPSSNSHGPPFAADGLQGVDTPEDFLRLLQTRVRRIFGELSTALVTGYVRP